MCIWRGVSCAIPRNISPAAYSRASTNESLHLPPPPPRPSKRIPALGSDDNSTVNKKAKQPSPCTATKSTPCQQLDPAKQPISRLKHLTTASFETCPPQPKPIATPQPKAPPAVTPQFQQSAPKQLQLHLCLPDASHQTHMQPACQHGKQKPHRQAQQHLHPKLLLPQCHLRTQIPRWKQRKHQRLQQTST